MTFNPLNESLDVAWLQQHGWSIKANLAYRHLLHDFLKNQQSITQERIQEILMQYGCDNSDSEKIISTLSEFVSLVRELKSLSD